MQYLPKIEVLIIVEKLGLVEGKCFVVSAHKERISTLREFLNLVQILNDIAQKYELSSNCLYTLVP